jgi:hypothetical protein
MCFSNPNPVQGKFYHEVQVPTVRSETRASLSDSHYSYLQGQIDDEAALDVLTQLEEDIQEAARKLLEELHENHRERIKKLILDCHEEQRMLDNAGLFDQYVRKQRYSLIRARIVYFDAFTLRIPRRRTSLILPVVE